MLELDALVKFAVKLLCGLFVSVFLCFSFREFLR